MGPKSVSPRELFSAYKIPIIFVAVALLVLIGALVYQESKGGVSGSKSDTVVTNTTSTAPTKLVIKELGVEVTLPAELKGMTYDAVENKNKSVPPIANLYLPAYTSMSKSCLGTSNSNKYPFAAIAKYNGKSTDNEQNTLKQFYSFRIATMSSGVPGGLSCSGQTTKDQLQQFNTELNNALKKAFDSAAQTS
jgi:hypothetical protein